MLHFAFHNGAMSTAQCQRLLAAIRHARARPTKVLVLAGGPDFWSNGIHLNAIEATGQPADASWENINAIDDVAREIVTTTDRLIVSRAVRATRARAASSWRSPPTASGCATASILNPHYKGMGNLYGSEYWTYLLPRRVGEARAREITAAAPADGREGSGRRCGLADARFGATPEEFLAGGHRAARRPWRRIPEYGPPCSRPSASSASATRPRSRCERYREEELARMKLNFYGFDPELPRGALPLRLQARQGAHAALPRAAPCLKWPRSRRARVKFDLLRSKEQEERT